MLREEALAEITRTAAVSEFQWAPTLGGECYSDPGGEILRVHLEVRFNGHPPLGVNATRKQTLRRLRRLRFQWAPTLGGECYSVHLFMH